MGGGGGQTKEDEGSKMSEREARPVRRSRYEDHPIVVAARAETAAMLSEANAIHIEAKRVWNEAEDALDAVNVVVSRRMRRAYLEAELQTMREADDQAAKG